MTVIPRITLTNYFCGVFQDGFDGREDLELLTNEIDAILENHQTAMSEVQEKHTKAMDELKEEMKQSKEQNEAMQKLLKELDCTLSEQLAALTKATSELEDLKAGRFHSDQELRLIKLDLEEATCDLNQAEEQIMHLENEIHRKNMRRQREEEEDEMTINSTVAHHTQSMIQLPCSTPNITREEDSCSESLSTLSSISGISEGLLEPHSTSQQSNRTVVNTINNDRDMNTSNPHVSIASRLSQPPMLTRKRKYPRVNLHLLDD